MTENASMSIFKIKPIILWIFFNINIVEIIKNKIYNNDTIDR